MGLEGVFFFFKCQRWEIYNYTIKNANKTENFSFCYLFFLRFFRFTYCL